MNFDVLIQTTINVPDHAVLHENSRGEILGFRLDGRTYRIWTSLESEDGTLITGAVLGEAGISLSYDESVTEELEPI